MKYYTVGYGGRHPGEFVEFLVEFGIRTVVDVRQNPNRAFLGAYVKGRHPDRGIRGLLGRSGIAYVHLEALGNRFYQSEDWRTSYQELMDREGDRLTEPLHAICGPVALMCSERSHKECHREIIADVLERQGYEVEHIE